MNLRARPRARSRTRTVALGAVMALIASLLGMMVNVAPAGASHGRANQLTWVNTGGNTVEFHYTSSWRCTFFFSDCSTVSPGDTFFPDTLYFGDGDSVTIEAVVTSVDVVNDVVSGEFDVSHTYATPGPFTAYSESCCRLGSSGGHVNNPDGSYRTETLVDLAGTSASPVSALAPIVDCPLDAVCQFSVPAVDPDGGTLRWRFATTAESGMNYQPGNPYAPNDATIDANTGLYRWDTTGATLSAWGGSTFYSTSVMVENLDSNGVVVAKTPIDFFIRLGSNSANQQPQFISPTPADGTVIDATVGSLVTFDVAATDPDAADHVDLGMLGKPASATYTTVHGNPASGTFSWTPTATGQTILTLTAQDPQGLGATPRSVIINVTDANPTNIPPVVDSGPDKSGPVGTDVMLAGSASDPDNGPVTPLEISWVLTALSGGADTNSCTFTNTDTVTPTVNCTVAGDYLAQIGAYDGEAFTDDTGAKVTFTAPPADTTPPVCELVQASSAGITVRVVDSGSGLASIDVTRAKNADVVVPAFTPGDTTDQMVTATKIKMGSGASVQMRATDVAGNATVCDPVIAELTAGEAQTFYGVPAAEHYLTVSEADGVAGVAVEVAGSSQIVWSPDGRTVDLGDMGDGTVTLRVLAPEGTTATVMLWDGK